MTDATLELVVGPFYSPHKSKTYSIWHSSYLLNSSISAVAIISLRDMSLFLYQLKGKTLSVNLLVDVLHYLFVDIVLILEFH